MLYTTLKFVHVFLAIIAIGFNATYGVLLARAAKEPEHELHVLRTVKVLDDRFANPAYALLAVTGVTMVLVSPLEFTTLWILVALILYGLMVALGAFVYSPLLRRHIQAVERDGPGSAEAQRLAGRGRVLGIVFAPILATIVAMMIFKPTL